MLVSEFSLSRDTELRSPSQTSGLSKQSFVDSPGNLVGNDPQNDIARMEEEETLSCQLFPKSGSLSFPKYG